MRVALVHDWLTGMRGGERVLEALIELYPECHIFTLLHAPGSVSRQIEARPISTSFLNSVPGVHKVYRYCLPLYPAAIERLELRDFDLVISVSHCVAKAIRVPAGVPHLSYCLTPMRYVWDLYDAYFGPGRASRPVRAAMAVVAPRLRSWDVRTSTRVSRFVACSAHVRERIQRIYERDAAVVYPPVAVERFRPAPRREDFYLTVSALVPYKRVDVLVEAFNRLGRRLVVVGDGSEYARMRRRAPGNITFTGRLSDGEVADLLGRCRAFVYAAQEDFGIVLVEAQASGAPVIAYRVGGAAEIVRDAVGSSDGAATGVLFGAQTPAGVAEGVTRFESLEFRTDALVRHAQSFAAEQFRRGLVQQVERAREST